MIGIKYIWAEETLTKFPFHPATPANMQAQEFSDPVNICDGKGWGPEDKSSRT